ncbi:MAG: hypothetical protein KBT31_01505 [Firmicutes bacterium]|nr:hypothetical protein [Candidatus Colimorpha enterica]
METELTERREARLKSYDYGKNGVYFVTVCVKERRDLLSEIISEEDTNGLSVGEGLAPPVQKTNVSLVGEGLAPPAQKTNGVASDETDGIPALSGISVRLKPCGEIAAEQLRLLENRFPRVTVRDYVIMPDHIHAIIVLSDKAGGPRQAKRSSWRQQASYLPSPTADDSVKTDDAGTIRSAETLNDVICAFKSLTSRICKQRFGVENIFQRSYYDHIIRDREDYEIRRKYIYDNPAKRYFELNK